MKDESDIGKWPVAKRRLLKEGVATESQRAQRRSEERVRIRDWRTEEGGEYGGTSPGEGVQVFL
jgi:hypothetical protein